MEKMIDEFSSWQSSQSMDEVRQYNSAYEYLCRLEEAKIWMESILKETLPPTISLEENLRNGVYLAKIGHFVAPDKVPLSRIYDIFQHRYRSAGLQFRHTDNINYWIEALKAIGLPKLFIVETTDVYDKKNMPKVIYCIHALSAHLFRLGQAPSIHDLFGKVKFSKQDIDLVSHEIEKSGISIPSFQRIGGLLEEEVTINSETMHKAIVNLNRAIDEGSEQKLMVMLKLHPIGLSQIIPEHISHYLSAFKFAKQEKIQAAQNRSLNNENYEPSLYEELLNQSEIQGYIRKVNIDCVWQDVLKSVTKKKKENLKEIIASSFTEIKDFKEPNIDFYVDEALSLDFNNFKTDNTRDIIQTIIRNGNRHATEYFRVSDAVAKVKRAITSKNKELLLNALRTPSLKLSSDVSEFAVPLYMEEMQEDLKMSKELTYNDIKSSINVLNGIAKITSAVDSRDCESTWRQLSNSDIPFMNIDPALKTQYFKALCACREKKMTQNEENCLLTFIDVQECIDLSNMLDFQQTQALICLEEINESIRGSNLEKLIPALQGLFPEEMTRDDAFLCMNFLKKTLSRKQKNTGEEIWLDDVKSAVKEVKICKEKVLKIFKWLDQNQLANDPPEKILKSIENYENGFRTGREVGKNIEKANRWTADTWLMYKLNEEIKVYLNPRKKIFKWFKPTEVQEGNVIEGDLQFSRGSFSFSPKSNSVENLDRFGYLIVRLQAVARGFVVRRKFRKILKAIIVIQRWWRKMRITKFNRDENTGAPRKKFPSPDLGHYEKNLDKIIKVQSLWRGRKCRKNFHMKLKINNSTVEESFQFLRNLALSRQINSYDYSTDLKVQAMKSCVVETIKMNRDLARKIEEMDTKIGLLVQNRMSVEAIVAERKNLQHGHVGGNDSRGIKAFSKEAKRLLDGYQQLFYLLQTDPAYLTKLIVRLPSRLNHVIQSCVLSIFNYGSNSRDAYLLLRLFRSALHEEVRSKLHKPIEAITGNPLVLRLGVAFARQAEGHNPLRSILGFLIEKVLNDKAFIDTNPVDIYRRWINQMETDTGRASRLPQVVTPDEALSHPEVVNRLNHNLRILKSWVKCFLDRLSECVNQFPYALRFIAKLLKNALIQKFPTTPEKDILKIVGNLVYYQYINSAIVAPDAFYTVSLPPNEPMRMEQRRNLASIAKILHFAATKKGFGEESKYLMCLNPFIVECHKEMKRFCQNCCAVEDLEEHFHVTKYTEAALIEKPRIYISLEEIRECHKLLLEVRQEIAPDSMDPIHEILDDLGTLPSLATLAGCSNSYEGSFPRAGKTQVCLELDNKFQIPPEDPTETEKLFIKTKELIASRLDKLNGKTLTMAIRDLKHVEIAANLARLELAGAVKSSDDYGDIVKSLIKDFSHRQEYRRMQNEEINVLRTALRRLNEKRRFCEEQVANYEQYLKTCLDNLTAPCNKAKKIKKEKSLKYSGTRLREKGILISLDGVPPGQLKNVQFEISTTKFNGIYTVHGRFMGIEVEKIDIDIQDLLKLQFEGLRELDLFGKARINVNLLLHLLNKKFHART